MLQRLKVRSAVYGAVIFCVAFQLLSSPVTLALNESAPLPEALTLAVPTGGSPHSTLQTDNTFSFNWHAIVTDSVAHYQVRISNDLAQVGEAPDSSDAWYSENLPDTTMPASTAPLSDGTWYWQVRAFTALNKSAWSDVWSVQLDTAGPAISISQPLEGAFGNVPISLWAEIIDMNDITRFDVELDGQMITDQVTQTASQQGILLSMDWVPGQLAEGAHVLKLSATDINGHSNQLVRPFKVDTQAPEITISALENQLLSGVSSVEVTGNEPGIYAVQITSGGREIFMGSNTDLQEENPLGYKYLWNTWGVPNGSYEITLTGKDSLGNEVRSTRQVVVANTPILGVVTNDPLLEELSAQLSQPLIAPQPVTTVSNTVMVEPPKVNDFSPEQKVLLNAVPEFVPVAATENGWRLFGILWYWWLLGGLAVACSGMIIMRNIRTAFSQVPDRV